MTTIDIIRAELRRQSELPSDGSPYFNDSDPRCAIVDGRIDLVALAEALDRARTVVAGAGLEPA